MKQEFKNVEFFSATSDIWSRSNRSYIACTVHYFDQNLILQSRFIACERFTGNHTNDRVAQKLRGIFNQFGITEKVYFITTDGTGEYTAAAKYHADNYRSIKTLDAYVDFESIVADNVQNDNSDDETDIEYDNDLERDCMIRNAKELHNMPYAMPRESTEQIPNDEDAFRCVDLFPTDTDDPIVQLPNLNRISCFAHLLDHLGKNDALNAKLDPTYNIMYTKVFKKLEAIWEINDSRLHAEVFHKITGQKIVKPHRIRWSKTFCAVSLF